MQHKLLGSTALVSAGLVMSGGALAQETTRVGGIEVVLGGYTEFGVSGATEDTLTNNDDNRNYFFFMDNEVFINANGATASGILYGSKIELEVGSGNGNAADATVDEVALYFSGNFGRIELGREDGAEDVMGINGANAQAGTGGIDGDTTNLVQFEVPDTGDSNKATYFTPRVAGFQLGASFVPDNGDGINTSQTSPVQENVIGGGINWVGALGAVRPDRGRHRHLRFGESGGTDDQKDWDAGILTGFGGFTLGGGVGMNTDLNEAKYANVGLKYGFGGANVSVGWVVFDPDGGETTNLFAVSGDVGLLPGVTLKADGTYNTEDPGANEDGSEDETLAGVVTVQLDY